MPARTTPSFYLELIPVQISRLLDTNSLQIYEIPAHIVQRLWKGVASADIIAVDDDDVTNIDTDSVVQDPGMKSGIRLGCWAANWIISTPPGGK